MATLRRVWRTGRIEVHEIIATNLQLQISLLIITSFPTIIINLFSGCQLLFANLVILTITVVLAIIIVVLPSSLPSSSSSVCLQVVNSACPPQLRSPVLKRLQLMAGVQSGPDLMLVMTMVMVLVMTMVMTIGKDNDENNGKEDD